MSHTRYDAVKVRRRFLQGSGGADVRERISSLLRASAPIVACELKARGRHAHIIRGEESEGRHGGRWRGRAKGKRGPCPTPGVLLTRCTALP